MFAFDRPEFLWLLLLAIPLIGLAFWSKRRLARWRRISALMVRLALLAGIVLSLAGLTRLEPEEALGVIFVARPLSVWVSTIGTDMSRFNGRLARSPRHGGLLARASARIQPRAPR